MRKAGEDTRNIPYLIRRLLVSSPVFYNYTKQTPRKGN